MKYKKIFNDTSNIEVLEENIWVIHNFITEKESEQYLNFAKNSNEEDWWKENSGWYKGKFLNCSSDNKIMELSNSLIQRFSNLFKNGNEYSYGSPSSIHRLTKGQDMFVHADFSEIDNLEEDIILFNTAIYHNDVGGGNIYYPEIGIDYHPVQGDVVMHPGTTRYRHGVKEVTEETRYISTLWVANELGIKIKTSGNMMKE